MARVTTPTRVPRPARLRLQAVAVRAVAASLLVLAPGCAKLGLPAGDGATSQPERVHYSRTARVAVSPFQNSSGTSSVEWRGSRESLAETVRDEARKALRQSGAFQLVEGAARADLLVQGDVTRLRTGSAAGPDELSLQLRVVDRRSQRALAMATVTGTAEQLHSTTGEYRSELEKTVRVAALRGAHYITSIAAGAGLLEVGDPEAEAGEAEPSARRPLPPPDARLEAAQNKLNALGYGCGGADGRMGPRTRACLSSYQEEMGLEPTGQLDDATASQLNL